MFAPGDIDPVVDLVKNWPNRGFLHEMMEKLPHGARCDVLTGDKMKEHRIWRCQSTSHEVGGEFYMLQGFDLG